MDAARLPEEWLALARAWAGPARLALIVGGSHARGEAVWARDAGRAISLSDLDLYAVVRDRAAQRAALARRAAARRGLAARLRELGLAAPLEVSFLTPGDLGGLPARPGTIELKRHGRVVDGDPSWLARVPDISPRDIGAEEILLLLENRAFELLGARASLEARDPIARLAARHATLKTALDLAGVACLAAGEYPDGAAARVARARPGWPHVGAMPPWDAALAWQSGRVESLGPAEAEREWLATAAAWVAAWRERVDALPAPGAGGAPDLAPRRAAARARLRRRMRQALFFRARGGRGPTLVSRLRWWARGTPQHRLNASAAVVLAHLAAPAGGVGVAAPDAWRRALAGLGVVRRPADAATAGAELVRLWDRWILDGQRGGGDA